MSTLNLKNIQLGDNPDPSKNFVLSVPAVADGTLSIKRQDGTNVLSVDATGKAVIPGVVGTVAQVGGVPTGQVIESGSNANGAYVRFADGTQICHHTKEGTVPIAGSATAQYDWIFPAVFSGSAQNTVRMFAIANPSESQDIYGAVYHNGSSQTSGSIVFRNGANGQQLQNIWSIAIGRWF